MQSTSKTLEIFGIRLVGVNTETGKKLLFTLVFIAAVWALSHACLATFWANLTRLESKSHGALMTL